MAAASAVARRALQRRRQAGRLGGRDRGGRLGGQRLVAGVARVPAARRRAPAGAGASGRAARRRTATFRPDAHHVGEPLGERLQLDRGQAHRHLNVGGLRRRKRGSEGAQGARAVTCAPARARATKAGTSLRGPYLLCTSLRGVIQAQVVV